MKIENPSRSPENAALWFIKLIAGGLVFWFLSIHFVVNHLVAPGGLLTFKDVVDFYQNPFVLLMEGAFLAVVLIHAILGIRSIILDLNPSIGLIRILDKVFIFSGGIAFIYGIWLLIVVSGMGV
jgi:succinate dehydrogenase / fumarate reductase membrane anchor subunit